MTRTLLAAVLLAATAPMLQAGPIERACLQSDRAAANRQICGCIQYAANQTLSNSDQRRAAGFFKDPHESQVVRASKSARDNEFWARYRNFGAVAEGLCAR